MTRLTRAEQEVAECVAKGWSRKRIASWLGIGESTVTNTIHHIAQKVTPYGDLRGYPLVLHHVTTNKAA